MRSVLYDLHRAEAILQVEGLNYGHDEEVAKYYQVVLDKHHVTKAEFDSSLVWYTDHPQLFNKIYPKIMERVKEEAVALVGRILRGDFREFSTRERMTRLDARMAEADEEMAELFAAALGPVS